jgi:hypothetical protein
LLRLAGLSSSGGISAMHDEVEAPAIEPWCFRLSSSAWYLADADAEDMISSAALAKDDVERMSSGESTRGPLGPFIRWLFLRPPGTEYDKGAVLLEDDATPPPRLPRTRTVAGKAGGFFSSNLNRTREANSGVLLARDGANTPPRELPGDMAGEAKDSRRLELDIATSYLPPPVSATSIVSFEALAVGDAVCS